MRFDWTIPSTWTFTDGEHVTFADAALDYCENCARQYPDARQNLANLRLRANELRALDPTSHSAVAELHSKVSAENSSEGSGFTLLAGYVDRLFNALEDSSAP